MSKARIIIGWILAGSITVMMTFGGSGGGVGKIMGGEIVDAYVVMGLGDYIALIGVGEIITAILFLVPLTLPVGLLLQSAYWGGAIAANMIDDGSFVATAIILVVVWVTAFIRRPGLFVGLLPQPNPPEVV